MQNQPHCPISELPVSGCAHCRGDQSPGLVLGVHWQPRTGTGRLVGLGEYQGQPYGVIRSVRITGDSNTRCQVPECSRPTADAFVCHQCLDNLGVALADVPGLGEDLLVAIARQAHFEGSGGPGGPGGQPSMPYGVGPAEAWRALRKALSEAVTNLAGPHGLSAVSASDWLTRHLTAIAGHIEGGKLADAITSASARGRAVINSPAAKVYLGLCRKCQVAMHAESDAVAHRCAVCGEAYDVASQLTGLLEKVRGSLVSAPEMVKLQTVLQQRFTIHQVNGYVARKRLLPKGKKDDGTNLYLVGEFLDLLGTHHG